jgi:Domain of unknown function (DUF4261)
MTDRTQETSPKPKMIGATLFLEHLADIDYRLLIERVGGALGIDPKEAETCDPKGAIVIPAAGDVIMGVRIDAPYPAPLDGPAGFAYWWPDAKKDIARNKAHLMVYCGWSGFSRYDAHMRHLVLVRELVEQLPVIGVLWGSALVPTATFKGEFANALKGEVPFSLWVLIQYSKQPNGNILISTLGMRDFGQMEIETESTLPFDQTFDLVRKFGSHILANSPVVKDGDTIGLTADQRIKVRHVRSFRPDVNDNVYWLELADKPTVSRPQGFFSRLFGSSSKH